MGEKIPIVVPETAIPVRFGTVDVCPCQKKPIKLIYKKGKLGWLKRTGDSVKKNEVICEAEIEMKTIAFTAPSDGLLAVIMGDNEKFKTGDVLGYVVTR